MKKYAIFFPQFHRVKVNDDAWGCGFEFNWMKTSGNNNIAAANAFDYWSRRAPACGFYDLSNPNVIQTQFVEAASAGLDGFGIYHYRFEDGPELVAVEDYLRQEELPKEFGIFFIWANESWSRRWAGRDTELLKTVSMTPSRDEIRAHVNYLKPFMLREYYTKIAGRPLFVIYRPEFFRDPIKTLDCYREEFKNVGIDPLIGYFLKGASDVEFSEIFDFCYLFEPRLFFSFGGTRNNRLLTKVFRKLIHMVSYSKVEYVSKLVSRFSSRKSKSHSFSKFLTYFNSDARKHVVDNLECPFQNVLTVGWNNSPRYRDQYTAVGVPSVNEFLAMLSISTNASDCSENLPLLCNAWNEWSEGAAIEPCSYLGDELLKSYIGERYYNYKKGDQCEQ